MSILERLNTWRKQKLFWTAKEHETDRAAARNWLIRESNTLRSTLNALVQDQQKRELALVRAEVSVNTLLDVASYTFTVDRTLIRCYDKQLCKSITRKMIDGLHYASDPLNRGTTRHY